MSEELQLVFTSRILTWAATIEKLKRGEITQTIRSRREAYRFFQMRGSRIQIVLDGERLYPARVTEITPKPLKDLGDWDAEIGGFTDLKSLHSALKRAGFRFKPLPEYTDTFAIGFRPIKSTIFNQSSTSVNHRFQWRHLSYPMIKSMIYYIYNILDHKPIKLSCYSTGNRGVD